MNNKEGVVVVLVVVDKRRMNKMQEKKRRESIQGVWDQEKAWKEDIYRMWQRIFQDPEPFAQYYYEQMYPNNKVYTMWSEEEDDPTTEVALQMQTIQPQKLCGMIHLNPYKTKIGQTIQEIDYIVGVAVDEKMRRQGIMRTMLQEVMRTMRNERKPFTFLMPASEAYYTPFDFRFAFSRYRWSIKEKDGVDTNPKQGTNIKFLPYNIDQIEALQTFCETTWKQFDVAPIRTKSYIERLQEELASESGQLLLVYEEETLIGYMTYAKEESKTIIRECVIKKDVERVIEAFQQWDSNRALDVYLDWFHTLSEETRKTMTIIPTIMIRILDIEAMLSLLRAKSKQRYVIQVVDPMLEENNGIYEWQVDQHHSTVTRMEDESQVEQTLTIAQFVEIVFEDRVREVQELSQHIKQQRQYFSELIPFRNVYMSEIV